MSDQRWQAVEDRCELLLTLAEARDPFGILVFGVGRQVIHWRLAIFIWSISKPSLLVLLVRISALLFLFAPCLLKIQLLCGVAHAGPHRVISKNHGARIACPELHVHGDQPHEKGTMPNDFTTVVSESSNLGFNASTPASSQM